MLLSLNLINFPASSSKTRSSTFFPIPKPISFQYHDNKIPSLIRSSIADNSQAIPHSAIQRISDKLRSLGFTEQTETETKTQTTAGEIFIPSPNQLSKYRVGHTLDPSWSTPENPVPVPGSGDAILRYHVLRKEVKREREARKGEGRVPTLAELSLPKGELRRLRTIGIAEKRKLKVGKAGITEGIVNGIHERWRRSEVVKIVCEDLCRMNMKRTHDLLERKTGGLVVWRAGSKIVLYRGADYKYPYFIADRSSGNETSDVVEKTDVDGKGVGEMGAATSAADGACSSGQTSPTKKIATPSLVHGVGSPNRVRFQLPGEAQLAEETDQLLNGLGPRFMDWWGYDPLPVDADLLPAVVPGYRRPFRLLPYGIKPTLTNDEMTTLKRLGRPLPCHFALGRNRKLQGLAASIVKLWEKCEIAKVAVKRGVQNTNSELMAEELKWLTGGILLSRDREFIVMYRGKDFLPSVISSAIQNRRKRENGDKQWTKCVTSSETAEDLKDKTADATSTDELVDTNDLKCDLSECGKLRSTGAALERTRNKLSMALERQEKAEKLLSKLEKSYMPQKPEMDREGITEEERYMLRKVGLKMKPFLLMGRRGVFDGTIENMHLHWKYRELVKIILKERSFGSVQEVARTLETESGGILVAVERISKGYAVILYRGKNYTRPACLRPATLLSKKQAMKHSIEAQRQESLKLHVLRLKGNIRSLKLPCIRRKEAYNMQPSDKSRLQTRDEHGADSTASDLIDGLDAPASNVQLLSGQQCSWTDPCSTFDGNRNDENQPISSFKSVRNEACNSPFSGVNGGADTSTSCPNNNMSNELNVSSILHAKSGVAFHKKMGSSVKSAENQLEESASIVVGEGNKKPSGVVCLSNRDRLLLRKQALKMKNRPVLAVGRSNIVTGVAKAINTHFQKHPLAIVNVKGRAKGTSAREVVSKLEEATGAVLVSQEPTKVILYRGWGAGDVLGHKGKKNKQDAVRRSSRESGVGNAVSWELIQAIRLECGLRHHN